MVEAALTASTIPFFLAVTVFDLRWRIVPNKLLLIAAPLALAYAVIMAELGRPVPLDPDSPSVFAVLMDAVMAGILFAALLAGIAAKTRGRAMGMGDVKLAGVLGFSAGMFLLPVMLLSVTAFSLLTLAVLLIDGGKERLNEPVPFAPVLCAAAGTALFFGEWLTRMFVQLLF